MELPISMFLPHSPSRASTCPCASVYSFTTHQSTRERIIGRLKCNLKPIRDELSLQTDTSRNRFYENREDFGSIWDDTEFVEVIGIGSRRDAVLDFCLDSPFCSAALRFWNILAKESSKIQLQQRLLGQDNIARVVEIPVALQSCQKAVILVAGAGYGSDHVIVTDILRTVKSANGLVAGIILKPFSFEGRRRQGEVKELADKLQELTNFIIIIDTDALLKKDMVTLDEALKTANNAALMAMNAISVLVSETHTKHIDLLDDNIKEVRGPELKKILGSYKDAKIGFGSGYNIKTSILRAVYECPFLGISIKDLKGIVLCIISSSGAVDGTDVELISREFRQTTGCNGAVVVCKIYEPDLEPDLIVTTVITLGYVEEKEETVKKDSGMLSRLAQHLPFFFNIFGKRHLKSQSNQYYGTNDTPVSDQMPNSVPTNSAAENFGIYSEELQTLFKRDYDERDDDASSSDHNEVEYSEFDNSGISTSYSQNAPGASTLEWEAINRQNIVSGFQISRDWTGEGGNDNGSVATPLPENLTIYKLPVGVKPSEILKLGSDVFGAVRKSVTTSDIETKAEPQVTANYADGSKKQGLVSNRAASMLESERDSKKKWSPTVAIKYRGGSYEGRCQGGLPEGKGRLSFGDGNIYDGMWRYGKRSGLGTFYYSNGDVFRGSWRDDVMHGKGWFYFHTGDRWFVNLWKGKANGEGRFYSSNGDVFFGHFKDGWRNGHFLCINAQGSRILEIWDEGLLVSREELDTDSVTVTATA